MLVLPPRAPWGQPRGVTPPVLGIIPAGPEGVKVHRPCCWCRGAGSGSSFGWRGGTKSSASEVGELWCSVWRPLPSGLSRCPLVSWNLGLGPSCRGHRLPW